MSELYLMVTINGRERLADFISVYRENSVPLNYVALGRGTATNDMMGLLGLDDSAKSVILSVVTDGTWRRIKKILEQKIYIDVPGTGIAFTVPLSSVGGPRELEMLTAGQNFTRGDEESLKGTVNELLLVICNSGYSETVMDAARTAGAAGGTVVHAKGTGTSQAEKFLGITLASEKDVIFIVTKTAEKKAIMSAIMTQAGTATRAGAIVFSLPVTDTAGLRLLENDEEEEAPAADEVPAEKAE